MKLFLGVLLMTCVALAGCEDAPSPEAKKVAPADQDDDDDDEPDKAVQVTIASVPAGAAVTLDGAELGKTPYILNLKDDTEVVLTLAGFEPQMVEVEPDGDPNVVVKLVADPNAEPGAAELKPVEPAAADEAEPEKKAAAKPKKKSGPAYANVAKAKAAYKSGKIDRNRYDQIIRQLKTKRAKKLEKLDALYESGKIDKVERNRRKKVIDSAYKGG